MYKIFLIFYVVLNISLFQLNVYAVNKNQHWEYNKIFLGSEIIKMQKEGEMFYPKIKSHPNDRKLYFYLQPEIIVKEKNVKLISKNSKYIISNEDVGPLFGSHLYHGYENLYLPPLIREDNYKDPMYYCYQDKSNNRFFCYCQNFSVETLFHPDSPKIEKDKQSFGEVFKFEYIEDSDKKDYDCMIFSYNDYFCYFVKDLNGNYLKDRENKFIILACQEYYFRREGSFVNNINKNCPISKIKNEDGNYYRDCTIN
jgi:hypothetical protein